MMRHAIFILVFFVSFFCSGANVIWNRALLYDMSAMAEGTVFLLGFDGNWLGDAHPAIYFCMGMGGFSVTMTSNGSMGTWALVSEGDILDAAYFNSVETPLIRKTTEGCESNTVNPAAPPYNLMGPPFYLGVQAATIDRSSLENRVDNWDDPQIYTGEYIYGWIECSYEDGNLVASASAFDIDGGPMVVGGGSAIPEPSSGLLLLVGGTWLLLRRSRGTRDPTGTASLITSPCLRDSV